MRLPLLIGIPPEVTSLIIGVGSVLATFLVAILTRKGAREDNRIKEDDQTFTQLGDLADRYKAEAETLRARNAELEDGRQRILDDNLKRFQLQVERCRAANAMVRDAFRGWQAGTDADASTQHLADALMKLAEHFEDDHGWYAAQPPRGPEVGRRPGQSRPAE